MITQFDPAADAATGPIGLSLPSPAGTRLAVCGAHGGAGTTTLAVLLDPAADLGRVRPGAFSPAADISPVPGPLLLACRPTTWSAELATAAVTALTSAGHRVAALVIVGDGWPQTPVAAARYRLLSARTGAVIRVPFVPALRGCADPAAVRLPRGARRALARIRFLTAVPRPARPVPWGVHHEFR